GDEQQMMELEQALMTIPDGLILDETPEGHVPLIIAETCRISEAIRETVVATLIVDRNYRKVLAHTDRCVVLEKGRVVGQRDSATLASQSVLLTRYLGV